MGSGTEAAGRVRRRTVFYIEGYDQRGPSHYHALYRDEAAKQSRVNGLAITVGPCRAIDDISSAWTVSTGETETDYVFLRYDDLMRARRPRTNRAVLSDFTWLGWVFLRRGVYANMIRFSWPIALFFSFAPLLVVIAGLIAGLAGVAVAFFSHWAVGIVAIPIMFAGLVMLRPWIEPRLDAFWLGRAAVFAAEMGVRRAPRMEERTDAFAMRIAAAAMEMGPDEVLVVGHSVGSFLGVSAWARALRLIPDNGPQLSYLSLGQSIPMLGAQPEAKAFREELLDVARDPRLAWIDVSAASDPICYVLTDPLEACGLAQPSPDAPRPKLVSARYPKLFTPETYRAMKRDFYRHHFQYLMASELPGEYDYFLITAGDMTLARRFAATAGVANYGRFRKKGA